MKRARYGGDIANAPPQNQIRYIFLALAIYFCAAIDYIPVYGAPLYPIGVFFLLISFSIITYAITRHRLMDIEVIIKKTLVFAGLSSFVIACFSIPLFLLPRFFARSISGELQLWLLVVVGLVVASVVGPLNRILINITDKYLFQRKINYRLLLREASEFLAHVDSLKRQARTIVAFLLKKARITNAAVYAFAAPDRDSLLLKASRPTIGDNQLQRIGISHPIIEYFHRHEGPIEIHTLNNTPDDSALKSEDFKEIASLMYSLRAEAAIPCYGGEAASRFDKKSFRLKGILFLGHQKSDEPYSEEDLDVFFTLGQESSIAFENARLYDEAINRSIELARANEDLNKTNRELKETQAALMEEKKRSLLAGIGKSVAHEVTNPLTPLGMNMHFVQQLLGQLRTLHEACAVQPSEKNQKKFQETLETAKSKLLEAEKGKDRIKAIIETLRDLVRERTGKKKAVQLKIVVSCAMEEVKYQTYWETLSAPTVDIRIPMGLPYINGIVHDLQGVFVNLFVNALHAFKNPETDKKIIIEACEDAENLEMVRIEFSDNGCGMISEVLAKCFEHGYTTKGTQGTGIGLFYCKYIIEEVHGGRIEGKSEVGVGTTFTIKLPRFKEGSE